MWQELAWEDVHSTNLLLLSPSSSIVFAPCLLRSASEDPLELLQNSKYEIKFLVLLFRTMAGAPSSQTMCVTQLQKGIDY